MDIEHLTNALLYPNLFGAYLGIVENDADPHQLGRVQVRIPAIHSDVAEDGIVTERLPWAIVCYPGCGSYGTGTFDPPGIGDHVIVIFNMGDRRFPIVIGSWHGVPAEPQTFGVSKNSSPGNPIPPFGSSMGEWHGKARLSIPEEAKDTINTDPTKRVIFKTRKGASLVVDEEDEQESLELVDRTGQGIRVTGRVTESDNCGNLEARGTRTVFRGNQIDYTRKIVDREVGIRIADLLNQGVDIKGRRNEERIKIQSKKPDVPEGFLQKAELREFDLGSNRQTIDLEAGHGVTVFEGVRDGQVRIRVNYDSNKPVIEIEATGPGSTIIINGNRFIVGADTVTVEGKILLDGDVMIAGDLTVTGEILEGKVRDEKSEAYV